MTGNAAGDFPGPMTGPRRAALKSALRHSQHVRALRIALPVCAGLLIAGVTAAIILDPRAMLAEIDAGSLGITGSKIVMEWPKFAGSQLDSSGKAKNYEIVASRAEQSLATPDKIDLFDLQAKMEIRENGWAQIVASNGHFDRTAQTLDLSQKIQVTSDAGDRADLTEARLDFTKGEIASGKPVIIRFERADLDAKTMRLYDTGNRAVFSGNVVMTLKPDPAAPVAPHNFEGLR